MRRCFVFAILLSTAAGCTIGFNSDRDPDEVVGDDSGMGGDSGTDLDSGADGGSDTGGDGDTDGDTDGTPPGDGGPGDTETDTDTDTGEPLPECVRYVDLNTQAPSPDGITWSTAFSRVQQGLDAAAGESIPCEVWVAQGTYGIYQSSPDDTVLLRPSVRLLGGFVGGETTSSGRDWQANRTVLDGGMSVYHVVTGSSGAVIDGFVITGGNAAGPTSDSKRGGGMFNLSSAPSILNCIFESNQAVNEGGAVYNRASSPGIEGCTFRLNTAGKKGGAIFNSLITSNPLIANCSIDENTAEYGGGMFNDNSSPTLRSVGFSRNVASVSGGAVFNQIANGSEIAECAFTENTAVYGGGGIFNDQGCSPVISRTRFDRNTASDGFGGAVFNHGNAGRIESSLFVSNSSNRYGGAVYNSFNSLTQIVNCSFSTNSAASGGGAIFNNESSPVIANSILWGDTPDEIGGINSTSPVSFCDVQGGYGGGTQIIDIDPKYANPAGGDLTLLSGSPCIDAADGKLAPDVDFSGAKRVDDGAVTNTGTGDPDYADLGAFERQ